MKRRGLTVIELLVVVAVIAVMAALLIPAILGARQAALSYQRKQTHDIFVAEVVNSREVFDQQNNAQTHRLDVRKATIQPQGMPSHSGDLVAGTMVDILDNSNDSAIDKHNAEMIMVNTQPGWYQIETMGVYDPNKGIYPNVIRMTPIPAPPPLPVAEIGGGIENDRLWTRPDK